MQWLVLLYHKCLPQHMPGEPEVVSQLSGMTWLSWQRWSHTVSHNSEISSSHPKGWGSDERKRASQQQLRKQIWPKDVLWSQSWLSLRVTVSSHLETIHHQVEVLAPGSPQSCIVLQQEEKVLRQLSCFAFYGRQREPQDPDQALQRACDHLRKQNAELTQEGHGQGEMNK